MLAPAAYVASRLVCWRRMRAWFPLYAECDMLNDDHLWFCEPREAYANLRECRGPVAAVYAPSTPRSSP
eukprot:5109454-Prymnesium_polylepis.1